MERWISVLMAVDEQYATPLLVTVGSLLEKLRPGVGLELYLMGPVAPETRGMIEGAWGHRIRLHSTPFDDRKLAGLRGYGYSSSPASYRRLLAGSSLPTSLSRVIYLDADLLIRKDIVELWERAMDGNIVLAVQDSYIQELPEAEVPRPYFNSGVMVIDLDAWRSAGMEQCCLEAASRMGRRAKWLDQHLLNQCLIGRWGALPPVWNKQFFLDLFPDWRCSPYEEAEFRAARREPAIIHFCTEKKPWHPFCDHPRLEVLAYRVALERIASGAEPSLLQKTVEFFAAPHRRLRDTIAAAVGARRRRHAFRAMLPEMLRLAVFRPWTLVSVPVWAVGERIAMRLGM